ncbi:MAG: GNAT family N-acetyltransferase [candidate division Zixibacteria bacterium]|nr:GNAT family N-acetyltransferase [candidate division Zixibacteria bacterium]
MDYLTKRITIDFARTYLPEMVKKAYANAPIIAEIVQNYHNCDFYAAFNEGSLSGLMSYDLRSQFKSVNFFCTDPYCIPHLLRKLLNEEPDIKSEPVYSLLDSRSKDILEDGGHLIEFMPQYRMRYNPARIKLHKIPDDILIKRLNDEDIPEISRIYSTVPAMAWDSRLLLCGPYYGAFDRSVLVAIAGVQFNTGYVAEVGNIVSLPMYRRKGLARACTQAVLSEVARENKTVFLCVDTVNIPAINLYLDMGFDVTDTSYMCKFTAVPISFQSAYGLNDSEY